MYIPHQTSIHQAAVCHTPPFTFLAENLHLSKLSGDVGVQQEAVADMIGNYTNKLPDVVHTNGELMV